MKLAKLLTTFGLLVFLGTTSAYPLTPTMPVSEKVKACTALLTKTSFWHLVRNVDFGHYRLVREILESQVLENAKLRKRKEKAGEGLLLLTTPKTNKEFYLVEFAENEALIRTVDGKYYRIAMRGQSLLGSGGPPYRELYVLTDSVSFEKNSYSSRSLFEGLAAMQGFDLQEAKKESFEFVEFSPGKFLMGSPKHEKDRHSDERQHEVMITKPYEFGRTQVTHAQWYAVMGNNPARFKEDGVPIGSTKVDLNKPIENVSWNDAQEFILRLNESQSEYTYRLPTEAEWEYAVRAGTTTAYFFGDNPAHLSEYAHFSSQRTTDVATRKPNPAGLYVTGNVWEWTLDWYASDYPKGTVIDPIGPSSGSYRVLRGGSWGSLACPLRSAYRNYAHPGNRRGDVGFRLVRTCL